MKKIVVAMLLLLPLIIVAGVLVAAGVISNEAYIAVEGVSLNVDTTKTRELSLSQEEFKLVATVYPNGARNKAVKWTTENVQCFGDEIANPVEVDDTGLIKFYTYCTFDVVVTTVEAGKTARCNFYVKCDRLNGISIDINGSNALGTGERRALKAVLEPADAEISNLAWSSSAPEVLSVDGNGIVTARKAGTAEITVTCEQFTAKKTLTVVKGISAYGDKFAVGGDFNISDFDFDGEVTAIAGGEISGGVFRFAAGAQSAVLSVDGRPVAVEKCDYDEIILEHADILGAKVYYIGKLPLYLNAVYRDATRRGETPDVQYRSDNTEIAEIDGNKVVFKQQGAVKLTASSGNYSSSITVEAVRPVTYVRLNTVDNDDKRGIAAESVYGNKVYKDGNLTDFVMPLAIQYPENADWNDFIITVGDERWARVEGHDVILTGDVEGVSNLTVSVTARYSFYESVPARANRNLKITNGVNCYTYEDLKRACADGENAVMQNNISVGSEFETLKLKANLYGNGYMLDATEGAKSSSTMPILKVEASGVKISNAIIRGDNIVNINMSNGLSGTAVAVGDDDIERLDDVRIEYSVLENCYYAISTGSAGLTVDGCIMRNTSNFGIYIPSRRNGEGEYVYSDVTMNNCIMSNVVATAIGIPTEAGERDGSPLAKQSSLTATGFLDIYNWQDVTAPKMLDREITGNKQMDEAFKAALGAALSDELGKDEYNRLRYTVNKDSGTTNYLHLGIVTAGASYESTAEISIEDARFTEFSLQNLFETHWLIRMFKLKPCVLYIYENTSDITPDSQFAEDAETYARLRGER